MEFIILAIVSAFAGTLADNVINSATSTGGTNMLGGLPVEMITMLGSSVLVNFSTCQGGARRDITYTRMIAVEFQACPDLGPDEPPDLGADELLNPALNLIGPLFIITPDK